MCRLWFFEPFNTCGHSAFTEQTCLQEQSPTQAAGTQCLLFKASLANKYQKTPMCAPGCSANRSAALARSRGQAWRAWGTHSPIFSSVEATAMRLMLCRYATSTTHICWWPYCLVWVSWQKNRGGSGHGRLRAECTGGQGSFLPHRTLE